MHQTYWKELKSLNNKNGVESPGSKPRGEKGQGEMKFALYIDYLAETRKGIEYIDMDATNILSAMAEADRKWDELNPWSENTTYLMRIMRKDGRIFREDGVNKEPYEGILCRRMIAGAWHLSDEEHMECGHHANRCWTSGNKNDPYWETFRD